MIHLLLENRRAIQKAAARPGREWGQASIRQELVTCQIRLATQFPRGRECLGKERRGCHFQGALLQTEMLTPKGEHFIPCSTRVMFDGRISFDGIATAKTLCLDIISHRPSSQEKIGPKFFGRKLLVAGDLQARLLFHSLPSGVRKSWFQPEDFSLRQT